MGWAAVVLAVAALAYHYWQIPLAEQDTTVQIEPGESMRDVAATLHETRPALPARVIYWTARFRGQARQIQAGEYEIRAGERLPSLLDRMVAGDVIEYRFTVPEGVRASEFLAQLAKAPKVRRTLDSMTPKAVIEALDLPVDHLEGWLFPTTYHYPSGTTDVALLRRAYRHMREELDAAWAGRADDLPIDSPYEALILASLIEKETAVPDERGQIAGVFVNRLERGMRLQTDPTVIYGMGDAYEGRLYTRHLREDTPYNTYTRDGLPPTPIALPSAASLRAATRPEETKALYFVADGTGGHTFSRTLKEHNRAVSRWRDHKREAEAN
ncbi:endolytic transglycosylase MltG [Guyparkeria hydrothermalis]|uniref:endolytic transglycosylase MltG n=1 Tax=Guyparkeria hydrothermalis TaxID=923 RepID=UPI002021E8EF|nr:endolytic transglycosylase MltG [Guyparkeria hydrothermalis]MCL7743452.1 endolytic transglycosylase MltG [Guyparkeria hydrothermalis]